MSVMLFVSQVSILLHAAVPQEPIPVILDTDIGSDIDDTWALAMMLGSPQIDLKLITTAFRDTPVKTRLVAKMLERWNRTDIPIGTGLKTDDGGINQLEWLGEYDFKKYPGMVYEDGVQALIDTIKKSDREITLVVLGPQMNISEALKRDPSIAEKARVVTMAGSVHIGYQGHEGRQPEWNVRADIEAARAVFNAPWEIVINPLASAAIFVSKGNGISALRIRQHPARRWSSRTTTHGPTATRIRKTRAVSCLIPCLSIWQ